MLEVPSISNIADLLTPHRELTDEETESLFASVRHRLLAGLKMPVTGVPLRTRLEALNPIESLPLLFAMRLVARRWGNYWRYWPEFRTRVLNDDVKLEVLYQVGHSFRQLWLEQYQYTNRALYYPREGQANIKWPLAHAGLLTEDQNLLRKFGVELKSEWDSISVPLPPLLTAEVDEFWLALVDWLQGAHHGDSHLAKMLLQPESVALTVAELAQRWLATHFDEVPEPVRIATKRTPHRPRPRVILRYDEHRREVLLLLGEIVWQGRAAISVLFADREHTVPVRYNPAEDVSRTEPLELPLSSPSWPEYLELKINSETHRVSVLRSPFQNGKGALLFQMRNGQRKRRFHVGETYYLIVPDELVGEEWMSCIFDEPLELGPPVGKWEGYETLLVTVKNPLTDLPTEGVEVELERINQQLEMAASRLNLPGLDDFLQPQLRPVSGLLISSDGDIDTFDVSNPPYFELSGLWTEPITTRLERWDEEATDYKELAEASVPPPTGGRPIILEPNGKDYNLRVGLYRVVLETREYYEFRLLSPPLPQCHTLGVSLSFTTANTMPGISTNFSRQMLYNGTFRVKAFPFAPLTIRVRCRNQTHLRPWYANEDGILEFHFEELDIPSPAPGPLEVTAAFGAVASQILRFDDCPYLKDLSLEWELWRLRIRGRVVNRDKNRRVKITVFGVQPWQRQIWTTDVELPKNGWFDALLPADRKVARWLAVLSENENSDAIPEGQPWLFDTLSDAPSVPSSTIADLHGGSWDVWLPWAEWLEGIPHPPELHSVLVFSRLGSFIKKHERVWQLRSVWRPLTPPLQEHLMVLIQIGVQPTIALFATTQKFPLEDDGTGKPPATVLTGDDSQRVVELLTTADSPMVATRVNLTYGAYRALVEFKAAVEHTNIQYTICCIDKRLVVCSDCGLILPCQKAWHHHAPIVSGRTQCHGLSIVQEVSVIPAVLWKPSTMLSSLIRLMQCAAVDGGESLVTPSVEPWAVHLRDIYERLKEPKEPVEWLEKIGSIAQELFKVTTDRHRLMYEKSLQHLASTLEREAEGVGLLLSWLADWSE